MMIVEFFEGESKRRKRLVENRKKKQVEKNIRKNGQERFYMIYNTFLNKDV